MEIKRILVPIDFSPCARHALDWAIDLARRHSAQLHLMHVLADYDPEWYGEAESIPQVTALREELEHDAESALQEWTPDPAATGIQSEIALERSLNVASAILEEAENSEADLVVMGTHGRSGIQHVLLGSVAEKVVRRAKRPVLTVGQEVPEEEVIERILAPVDFSEHSKQALRVAKDWAATYEARLDMLFVAEERMVPMFSDTGIPRLNKLKMDPEIVKNSSKALDQLCDEVGGPSVEAQGHVAHGDVAPRIIDFSKTHGVGLIVIATRGLTGLNHFLIGSVAEKVVRRAPCPVLTVHTQPEESDRAVSEDGR